MTGRELAEFLADCLGLDHTSVRQYYRAMREAGLISQAGRGRGAAQMDALDAAHMLIAVCISPTAITACVEPANRCASLIEDDGEESLAEVLEAMIQAPPKGAVQITFQSTPAMAVSVTVAGCLRTFCEQASPAFDRAVSVTVTGWTIQNLSRAIAGRRQTPA